jgi:hypothetical protein
VSKVYFHKSGSWNSTALSIRRGLFSVLPKTLVGSVPTRGEPLLFMVGLNKGSVAYQESAIFQYTVPHRIHQNKLSRLWTYSIERSLSNKVLSFTRSLSSSRQPFFWAYASWNSVIRIGSAPIWCEMALFIIGSHKGLSGIWLGRSSDRSMWEKTDQTPKELHDRFLWP